MSLGALTERINIMATKAQTAAAAAALIAQATQAAAAAATQAVSKAGKVHAGHWSVSGKGKARTYRIGTAISSKALPGDRFKATSKAGVVTTGVLNTLAGSTDALHLWEMTKDVKSAEQVAEDRSARATANAMYWHSPQGVETVERINASKARKAEAVAAPPVAAAAAAPDAFSTMVGRMVAAGLTPDQAVAAAAAALGAPTAPVVAGKAQRKVKAPAVAAAEASAPIVDVDACEACGTVAPLTHHASGLDVCGKCFPADSDTLGLRAARTRRRSALK